MTPILFFIFGCNQEGTKIIDTDIVNEENEAVDTGNTEASDTNEVDTEDTEDTNETNDTDTDDTNDTNDTEDTGEIIVPPEKIRFVALGDGGEGNETQYAVADAMLEVCTNKTTTDLEGCEFALYLGDNFYDVGVDSVYDSQFDDKFELPYQNIDFPFYVVLGNHDAGGWGSGFELYKTEHQVDYTNHSAKWTMPNEYYAFEHGHASFFGLDTNALMWDPLLNSGSAQESWIGPAITQALGDWKIAFGHHPYISNGQHGNAGSYEGIDFIDWAIADVPLGVAVEDFMNTHICGNIDVYFSGHDHNRQWLEPACGTEFIVTGAAAKTTDLQNRGNPTLFEDDQIAGFFWVEIEGNCLTGEFYDQNSQLQFSHQFCK